MSSPSIGVDANLAAVAVGGPDDLWAVGNYYTSDPTTDLLLTLTERWNGTSWSVVPSPNVPSVNSSLNAVAVLSPTDAWAVGGAGFGAFDSLQTLIEHWNGTSWSIVASPNPGPLSYFTSVAALAANNVWAAGVTGTDSTSDEQTLIEHWDGNAWRVVASPNRAVPTNYLAGISAASASDIWAVGRSTLAQSLTEHWNGTSWSIVASPNVGSDTNVLWSVAAAASNDVWAVGNAGSGGLGQTLIEHWNGTSWSLVPGANPNPQSSLLYGVAALAGAGQPWAVGNLGTASGYAPLTERWNGSAWESVRAPAPTTYSGLNGVVVIAHPGTRSGADVWAVGVADGSTPQTSGALIVRYQPLALGLLCPAL
ncbi:MAG TPA: hypothetical protein VFU88_15020 [Ktedonobacterales bacterium]|nr:hypothetical protein [Ktedonobacterales bacterium]